VTRRRHRLGAPHGEAARVTPPLEFWGSMDGLDVATFTVADVQIHVGDPLVFHWRPNRFRRATLFERALTALRSAALSAMWWHSERYQVIGVQAARGLVTAARLQWSWRRWRWERCI
jgi:hypothetical protein